MGTKEAPVRNKIGHASAHDTEAALDGAPEEHFCIVPGGVDRDAAGGDVVEADGGGDADAWDRVSEHLFGLSLEGRGKDVQSTEGEGEEDGEFTAPGHLEP